MENSNSNSDSEYFWYTMNHSPDKGKGKGKATVFDVSSTCGFAPSSKSKSKALVLYDDFATAAAASSSNCHRHRNPRKRRSKLISFVNETTPSTDNSNSNRFSLGSNSSSKCNVHLKPKYVSKKPDPGAPKITRPCSECGKKFWSLKALFGHMRCHPERQWRGINPPPNFRRQPSSSSPANADTFRLTECYAHPFQDGVGAETMFTHDEHEVAACLLLLVNGDEGHVAKAKANANIPQDETTHNDMYAQKVLNCQGFAGDAIHASTVPAEEDGVSTGFSCGRFECSSCKKVFGSHQALGGHRASHKNVKGCFAITRTVPTSEDVDCVGAHHDLHDYQTQNHNHDNYTSTVRGDYHCYQIDQSQSTISVLLQEEETLDCKDSTTNASNDSKTAMALGNGHKCSICSKVFSSGQALGGHKRCHWEKADNETLSVSQGMITSPLAVAAEASRAALSLKERSNVNGTDNKNDLDLNLPAPFDDDSSSSYSSPLTLDLRLGI